MKNKINRTFIRKQTTAGVGQISFDHNFNSTSQPFNDSKLQN